MQSRVNKAGNNDRKGREGREEERHLKTDQSKR